MTYLFIDIETYSSVSLKESGVYPYTEAPDFAVLMAGYAIGTGNVKRLDLTDMFADLSELEYYAKDPECIFVAHNAAFERVCLRRIGIDVPPARWICTAVAASYAGYPRQLELAALAMGLKHTKDGSGKQLIKLFSIPQKDGSRTMPFKEPEKWANFLAYMDQDVIVSREILRFLTVNKLLPEQSVWDDYVINEIINDKGALCDLDFVKAAEKMCDELNADKHKELNDLLALRGLTINNLGSYRQWQVAVKALTGKDLRKTDKEAIEAALKDPEYSAAWDVLKIKQQITGSGVKKFASMQNAICADGRIRGSLVYYGAHTGRFSSKIVQLHNMPRTYLTDDQIETSRGSVYWGDKQAIREIGAENEVLTQLVRTSFISPDGLKYSVVDFSAIEARVISWLCGEEWKLEVFKTHGKIYEAAAAMMFGVPLEEVTKDLRAKGKIAELALGYQGGVNALLNFGAAKMGLSNGELKLIVDQFRKSNPNIVKFWAFADRAAKMAIVGKESEGYGLKFSRLGTSLVITLPSGRRLIYPEARVVDGQYGTVIRYKAASEKGYIDNDTHGGKLTNNIVQAIARDLLTFALKTLFDNGFSLVLHVHDEIVAEIKEEHEHETMLALMCQLPDWAAGIPQRAAGFVANYYKK